MNNETEFADKTYRCVCGEKFVWTVGEQKFMDGLLKNEKIQRVTPPKRCIPCRQDKREFFKNKAVDTEIIPN